MKQLLIISYSLFALGLGFARPVRAIEPPRFFSCQSPSGEIIASYDSGTHGIVGNQGNYSGADTVYRLDSDRLVQCFCPASGQGIQTNWWKVGSLSPSDRQIFTSQGWYYVPDGSLWGLEPAPYLAANYTISCRGAEVLGAASGSEEDNGIGGGEILGLADTGNLALLSLSLAAGVLCLYFGIRTLRTRPA